MDFNQQIIEEFRSNRGHVETMGFGGRLVLIHNFGAKSGAERINPTMGIPTQDGWLVAASAAGASKHPDWYHNLLANPEVSIEVPTADSESGIGAVQVRAHDLTGTERDQAWAQFTSLSPGFAEYEQKAGDRVIPVLHLVRR